MALWNQNQIHIVMKTKNIRLVLVAIIGLSILTSCNKKEESGIINPVEMNAETQAQIEQMCNSLGLDTQGGIIKVNEILKIDSQNELRKLAPEFADKINLDGNMLLVTAVRLISGSAKRSMELINDSGNCTWHITLDYRGGGTCDAPIVFIYNLYPKVASPIKLDIQVIED